MRTPTNISDNNTALKWVSKKKDVSVQIGVNWITAELSGGSLRVREGSFSWVGVRLPTFHKDSAPQFPIRNHVTSFQFRYYILFTD
jgi:hypothetical protein